MLGPKIRTTVVCAPNRGPKFRGPRRLKSVSTRTGRTEAGLFLPPLPPSSRPLSICSAALPPVPRSAALQLSVVGLGVLPTPSSAATAAGQTLRKCLSPP